MRLASRAGLFACVALAAPVHVHAPTADAPDTMRGAAAPAVVRVERVEVTDRAPVPARGNSAGGVMSSDAALLIGWTADDSGEGR